MVENQAKVPQGSMESTAQYHQRTFRIEENPYA
jgi:hypothetical protein